MVLPLTAALALSVVYRVTLNLPDLPYSHDLRRAGSEEFLQTAHGISGAVDGLLDSLPGEHRTSVFQFRYHQIIGTLAYLDIYSDSESPNVRQEILKALNDGFIGAYPVSNEGFELHIIKVSNDKCSPTEFQCSDGSCIEASLRCNHHKDCEDGSDESAKFAECKHHIPVIYQTDKVFAVPTGGVVHLSAIIDLVPENHQVLWSRNEVIIGENSLSTTDDERISVYRTKDEYFLKIDDVTSEDAGEYMISVQGLPVNATFEVRITADEVPSASEGCPEGEKACLSGHCLPVSQFCDRTAQCPDGDDEKDCSPVECSSTELRCVSDNVCVPSNVACDGWKDCHDGSDEHNCNKTETATEKPHHHHHHQTHHKKHSRLTVTCEDGSAPEYSLHGSSYCWSNSVCPTATACIQGLCCATGPNSTLRRCPSTQWECLDGTCLPWSQRCDGQAQCGDSGDERHCDGNGKRSIDTLQSSCSSAEFECGDGSCIPLDKKCNHHYDCTDGSDETTCEYYIAAMKHHEAHRETEEHQVDEIEIVPEVHDDDHEATTRDPNCKHHASHHQNAQHMPAAVDVNAECTDQEFRCPYLVEPKCFHYDKLCDGHDDCGDGSDEVNCESGSKEESEAETATAAPQAPHHKLHGECTSHQFKCHDGRCIEKSLECNRKYDCDDGSDETECEYFKSAMARRNNEGEGENREAERRQEEERRRQPERPRDDERRREPEREVEIRRREEELRRREEEERKREQEEVRREQEFLKTAANREQEVRRTEQQERRLEEEERRRVTEEERVLHEERLRVAEEERRLEEERRRQHDQQPKPTGFSNEVIFKEEYDDDIACLDHEFQCSTGECIDKRRVCDTRPDCLDSSDEANCSEKQRPQTHQQQQQQQHQQHHHQEQQRERHPAVPQLPQAPTHEYDQDIDSEGADSVQITIYPTEAQVRDGRDVTFDCRARTADNSVYPSVRWTRVGGPLPPSAHESGGRLTINPISLSDAGKYVCVATHNGQTVEAHAMLNVQSYGPQELQGLMPTASSSCMADEKACGNNECVKSDYVCDGEPDCRDRSDEANCPALRTCEPNEFKCNNQRCVQKMWLCDGDDDCGDNSDEQNCGGARPGEMCKATEFQCGDGRQCVPSSFHCDGTNDCRDGSDEVGCVQPTVVEPPETNKQVPVGDTFKLTCKAVAVPEAYINWRLNWGPVCEPPRCLQQSEGGYGTLTVNNAQPIDQGAYTCEAINVKGRVLATPDCIVRIVNIPAPPPPRPEPTREPLRATCDTRGAVSPYPDQYGRCPCKPLVTGPNCDECKPGAFHLSEKSPQGCLSCFCFGITNQCRSSSFYRTTDAACDRLMFAGDAEGVTLSDVEERNVEHNAQFDFHKTGYLTYSQQPQGTKYWKLPQRFLGDKVTAYGGKMEFEVEFSGSGSLSQEPMVVLKGNQLILVHRIRNQDQVLRTDSPVRITVETYETSFEQMNGAPATREDLLMVLADLDAFLIRASHAQTQYSSSLGDVSWEIAVDRYTPEGLALEVEQCMCPPGYLGTSCEDCAPGYERSGTGPYLGTCVPIQQRAPQCTGAGAVSPTANYGGRCQCKTYAQGANCDQCTPNSFYMAATNPQGCIPCFCAGVTQSCQSSSYTRTKVEIDYQRGDRDQLSLSTSDARSPFSPQTPGYVSGSAIEFSSFHEANGQTLYWKMPEKFLGNKVTAYGGSLKYTFRYSGEGKNNQDPHIIIRGNDISLQYTHREPTTPDRDNTIEIKIFEDRWQRVDGQQATREHLLMALADLDSLLIKATYIDDCSQSSLVSVSLEYAEPYGRGGVTAYEVEQCMCPPGYVGTSCEDCAPGYSRTGGGLYLGLCEKCECHGHASQCDKEYGFCVDCQHNTEGDQCERCKPGFVGDARRGTPHDCQPAATRPPCQCNNHSPRGCDSFGRCLLCEHNTEGTHCERCKKGFYGDATKGTPFDCTPCPCPGTSDCFLDSMGQVACRNCPAGLSGRLCNECAPGYTRSNKESGRTCEPIGSVTNNDRTYVPSPPEALRVRILEPKHQVAGPGQTVQWICQIVGHIPPNVRLEWTRVGHSSLPAGASFNDGYLALTDVQEQDAGQYRCIGTTVNSYATDDATLSISVQPRGKPPQPMIDPPHQTVNEGDAAAFRCWVPGIPDCQITFHKEHIGGALPHGVYQTGNALKIPRAQLHDAGNYICTAINQYGIGTSPNARLDVVRPVRRPKVDPIEQTVNEGEPARFRCWVPGNPDVELKWHRAGHQPLPHGVQEQQGILHIPKAQQEEAGQYVCTATDPRDGRPQESDPVTLNIRKPDAPPQSPQVDPPEQTVNEGDPAQFRCWVPGNPQAQLKWTREDGQALPQGTLERDGYLRISSSKMGDAGRYICTATDPRTGAPSQAPPATLNVKPGAPLAPEVDPADQTVDEGTPSRVRCWVPGKPDAQLRWSKRDRRPLPQGAEDRDGHLSIPRTMKADEGEYICTAFDPQTRQPVEAPPARINVRTRDNYPEISPPDQTVPEGDPSTIRCWVRGEPNAHLTFKRTDGRPLPAGSHENGGVLSIPSTQKSDEGVYVCTYHPNGPGGPSGSDGPSGSAPDGTHAAPKDSGPSRLNVESPAGKIEPLVDPSEQTIPEGSPFRIRCWVPGQPSIQLSWRKKDGQLNEDADLRQGYLTVNRAEASYAGDYVCSAVDPMSGEPVDSQPATVHVTPSHTAPVLESQKRVPEISPPEQTVPEGDPALIKCWVRGDPDASLSFKRTDGGPLPFGSSQEGGVLSIPATQKIDEGVYVCTYHPDGSTPGGTPGAPGTPTDSSPSKLNVESPGAPPRPVATPPVITVKPGEPARFNCIAHSPTPARISWGHLDQDTPLPEGVRQEGDDIVIDSASDDVAGDYICAATNDFGRGVAEPVKLVVTDDEQPPTARVEPRTWNGKPGDRHQFKCITTGIPTPTVTWTGPDGTPLPHDVTALEGNILDFANGRTELNGDYTCTATNPIGEASDHGAVNIGPSLTVKTTPAGPRLVLTVGEPLLVKCEAFGEPDPEVEWLHDPGPERGDLPDDWKPVTISEQFIRHPAIGLGNAGLYTCKGSNSHATATKDIYIEVVEPSRVATVSILGGSTQWFEQGEPSELICTATGSSLVDRLEWIKVHDQLPTDVEEHNEPGLLHFPNFKNNYAGDYECRGYRHDELIASSTVTVHSASDVTDDAKVEIEPPRVRVVSQGESIVLKCSVHGAENGENFEWALLRGGNLVRKLGDEPTLKIESADPSNDYGVYRCNVENNNGEVIGSAYTAVTVGYQDNTNAHVVKFDDHSDASFVCPVYSVPGSKVEWSRQDGDLPTNAVPNGNKLEIKDFDEPASGLYVCTVTFANNVVEGYVHAQIFVPDTIIQVLLEVSSESVGVGDRAWFDCKVTGDPSAEISWSKEGAEQLPENSQVTSGRLLFTDVVEENAGVYRCRAKTKAGPLETRTVLNIGSAKRKRKHARRGRHAHRRRAARHQRRRHVAAAAAEPEKKKSLLGSWFSTN